MTNEQLRNANLYAARIKNGYKRWYAYAVIGAMFDGKEIPERPSMLSAMAAQAVRIHLATIFTVNEAAQA